MTLHKFYTNIPYISWKLIYIMMMKKQQQKMKIDESEAGISRTWFRHILNKLVKVESEKPISASANPWGTVHIFVCMYVCVWKIDVRSIDWHCAHRIDRIKRGPSRSNYVISTQSSLLHNCVYDIDFVLTFNTIKCVPNLRLL